jgi:mono/diheme cytochrome c family protein
MPEARSRSSHNVPPPPRGEGKGVGGLVMTSDIITRRFAAALLASGLAMATPASPQARKADPARGAAVERGRYIVEQVAMCVECHTPRDADGHLLRERVFKGAPVPVVAPFRGQTWALEAPNIAGMKGYTEETGIRLLSEGISRTGAPPRPPMPPFRMTREDASAVVAYLMSIP